MRILYLLFALALAACSPGKTTVPAAQSKQGPPPMPVSETVFAPAVSAMDKARTVEGTLQKDKDNADAALKAAE